MEVRKMQKNNITIIELAGEMNSVTSMEAYEQINTMVSPGDRLLLDMTNVSYMSSAGIRTLLLLYRRVCQRDGQVVLVGLSEDIRDTMSITGFLDFFSTTNTVDSGLQALQ